MNVRSFTYVIAALLIAGGIWMLVKRDPHKHQLEGDARSSPKETIEENGSTTDGGTDFAGLDERRQKFIWDAEHLTFEVESYVGKPFASQLLKPADAELSSFFTSDFFATGLQSESSNEFRSGPATEVKRAKQDPTRIDASGFAKDLAAKAGVIPNILKTRFRILQIRRLESSESWRLELLLTAYGTDESGKRMFYEQHATLTCLLKDDEQIRGRQIIQSWQTDSESLRTSPVLFSEFTKDSGFDELGIHDNWKTPDDVRQYTSQMACADFNLDGYNDLAICTNAGQLFLLKSDKGKRFKNVTTDVGLSESIFNKHSSFLATWFDFNNDGYPDLLVGSTLYENDNGKKFNPVNSGLRLGRNPMGSAVADYDGDGLLDLYLLYQDKVQPDGKKVSKKYGWVSDDETGAVNQLWKNRGNGRFVLVTSKAGVGGGKRHSFAATWLHANDDVYPDLYVANDFARNSFFLNNGDGTFKDISEASGTSDFATSMGVTAGDLTGDGKSEIYVSNMYSKMGRRIIAQVNADDYPDGVYAQLKGACAGNRLYQQTGDGEWNETSNSAGVNAVGWAYAPALTDFDGDGRLDIYSTAGFLSFSRDKPDG